LSAQSASSQSSNDECLQFHAVSLNLGILSEPHPPCIGVFPHA
jgi:hypothetical protein